MTAARDQSGSSAGDTNTEDATLADEEWPVAEHYRVEPVESTVAEDDTIVVEQPPPVDPTQSRRFAPDPSRGLVAGLLAALVALLLIPAGFWLASREGDETEATAGTATLDATTTTPTTTQPRTTPGRTGREVPYVSGRTLPEARELLQTANLRVRVRRIASDRPRDEVLNQAPSPGIRAGPSSIVVLTVSGGPARIVVPGVEGIAASEALRTLRELGLRARARPVTSVEQHGTVIAQHPAPGEEVAKETTIALQIAQAEAATTPSSTPSTPPPPSEPTTVRVPSLVGTRSADARARLRELGLRSTQRPVESSRPAGTVVSQSPGAGARVREESTVTLRISTGPATVAIPDVVGLDEASAVAELEAAGFVVQVTEETTLEQGEDGIVVDQRPTPGSNRHEGTTVAISVARFSTDSED
jgi:beta-lactam-binding protein with PASTA domain